MAGAVLAAVHHAEVLTVVPGRATRLQGSVHLTLLAAFLCFSMAP